MTALALGVCLAVGAVGAPEHAANSSAAPTSEIRAFTATSPAEIPRASSKSVLIGRDELQQYYGWRTTRHVMYF